MKRIPKYSLHKATGQALVRINGRAFYLGEHGSEESKAKYDRLIAKWLTGDKLSAPSGLTIARLCLKYVDEHVKSYYVKNGRQTSEVSAIQAALRPLVKKFGRTHVNDFGPTKLKQVRQAMVDGGIVRTSINRNIGRIRRMFKWGVENELVNPGVHTALTALVGLRYGRSPATESSPVLPVPDADIDAVKPHVSRQVWAMIQLQLASGMRPGEVRIMRIGDIIMSADPWEYRPLEHKTQHHGRDRVIFIGPIGQDIVRPFLKADRDKHLFSPAEARAEFDAERRENRVSPMTPSQRARKRLADPQKQPGLCYSVTSYARAIKNACEVAEIPTWTPNRLRHNAATNMRKQFDIESVRTILGHATGFTTEIYAELDHEKARSVIARIG
ncbi:MAG: site-specific integrase [Fuerstiella sp.]